MSKKYTIHTNPYNHTVIIGKLLKNPEFIQKPQYKYSVMKVVALSPRDYVNHTKAGDSLHKNDAIKATGYVSPKQEKLFQSTLAAGQWVVIHGELRSVEYYNKKSPQMIKAQVFNLEDVKPLKIASTDYNILTPEDKKRFTYAERGLNWLLQRPSLVHKFRPDLYKWFVLHDAFSHEDGNLSF